MSFEVLPYGGMEIGVSHEIDGLLERYEFDDATSTAPERQPGDNDDVVEYLESTLAWFYPGQETDMAGRAYDSLSYAYGVSQIVDPTIDKYVFIDNMPGEPEQDDSLWAMRAAYHYLEDRPQLEVLIDDFVARQQVPADQQHQLKSLTAFNFMVVDSYFQEVFLDDTVATEGPSLIAGCEDLLRSVPRQ